MILTRQKLAHVRLYVATTLVIAFAAAGHAQDSADHRNKSHEELRAAFEACREELGVAKPEPGQRPQAPDEETRAQLDACLKEKGFEPPPKFGGPRGGLRHSGGSEGGSAGVQ